MRIRPAIAMMLVVLWAVSAFSQSTTQQRSKASQACRNGKPYCATATTSDNGIVAKDPTAEESKKQSSSGSKRLLWVAPDFEAVSANQHPPPLSTHGKFVLATRDSFDYSSFTWAGILAAQSYALNSDPELGRGGVGYLRYYWRTFADGVSSSFFTQAIVPSITHEDPRYYILGHGGFFHRVGYALSRVVVTKTDSGGTGFNWSEVGGNLLVAGLSNAYYPPQERGLSQTFRDYGGQIEGAALDNIASEFWPDIRRKLMHLK